MSARAYYNEHDPKAAAWLRELINAGLIAPGDVDTRDIQDVSPHDLTGYTQQHFFAGIGGWSLALRLAGWPDDRAVRTGSCPCQPFSAAGKGLGEADERHLWPVFRDLITFGEPTATFGEQVASAAGRLWLSRVRVDLEGLGYAVGAADLCSAGVGAPNIRQRLYWMADPDGERRSKRSKRDGQAQRPEQPSPRWADAHRCSGPGGMADRASEGWHERWSGEASGREPQQPQRLCAAGGPADGAGGLGNAGGAGGRRNPGAVPCAEGEGECKRSQLGREPHKSLDAGQACGLGDANDCGKGEVGCFSERARTERKRSPLGFWSAYELLHCTDGKARRIEPGSFPLAHGVSGRVGLLRGYGNAINPWVAAEFIQACRESGLN